jgi:hypothetical protein
MRRTQLGERMALRLSRGLQAMIGARTIATAALCCGLGCLGVGLEPWRDTDSPPPARESRDVPGTVPKHDQAARQT